MAKAKRTSAAERSLVQWLQILAALVALFETDYKAKLTDGKLGTADAIDFGGKVIDLLIAQGITLVDLRDFLNSLGPLLSSGSLLTLLGLR